MKFPGTPFLPFTTIEDEIDLTLKKATPLKEFPTIPEFYANQEIFITGATGFIGKVLIEKLLRSCPDVKRIYVLLRPQRGKAIEERLRDMLTLPVFDALRRVDPNFSEKIIPVSGDLSELQLGLSSNDVELMRDVSIVFHSAASVRFDDSLKYSVLMNTRGTREVMEFASKLQKLKVVMHVSTTYSNVYVHKLEEKVYPPAADWRKTIEICEKLDEDILDKFSQHYIGFMPNTYVFSKNLAEHVSNYYKEKLPVVILRPSIVVGVYKEPLLGWVDNLNGPMGILLASALGLSKTMVGDPRNIMDMIPVDVCVKAMIIGAWKRANDNSFVVYNCAVGNLRKVTIKQILDIGISSLVKQCAFEFSLLTAGGGVTLCEPYNLLRLMTFQILPSCLADFALKLKHKNPKVMRIQRRMFEANKALSYFVTNNWDFINENFFGLSQLLRDEDLRDFDFVDFFKSDVIFDIHNLLLGMRRYLRHEKDESLERCRKRYKTFMTISKTFNSIPYFIMFYLVFFKYDAVNMVKDFV